MPLRSERGTGAPKHHRPLICHRLPSHLMPSRPLAPLCRLDARLAPSNRLRCRCHKMPARLPVRPTSSLSPWSSSPCPLHSISQRRTGHSRSPLDHSYLLSSFIFFLVSFTLHYHTPPAQLPALSDDIIVPPCRSTGLHPPFRQLLYIQRSYPIVTQNGTIQLSDAGPRSRYLGVYINSLKGRSVLVQNTTHTFSSSWCEISATSFCLSSPFSFRLDSPKLLRPSQQHDFRESFRPEVRLRSFTPSSLELRLCRTLCASNRTFALAICKKR